MAEIFPQRDLPERAQQWGRSIEGEILAAERLQQQVTQRDGNWSRASAGRLAVLGRNLDEVAARSSVSLPLPAMSVSGSATVEPFPRSETVLTFPAVPGNRSARVVLSGTVFEDVGTTARLYAYLYYQGLRIGSAQVQPFTPGVTPAEWNLRAPIQIIGVIDTVDMVAPQITVRIVRGADTFSPGTSTMSLPDGLVTLVRSGTV